MKFLGKGFADLHLLSHPTRGAWIEIVKDYKSTIIATVAPHTGCVD